MIGDSQDVDIGEVNFNTSISSSETISNESESHDKITKFIEMSNNMVEKEKLVNTVEEVELVKCRQCGEVFSSSQDKYKHVREKHSKMYECRYCDQQLRSQKQFKHHLLAHKKALMEQ